jgi:hypothetical protein
MPKKIYDVQYKPESDDSLASQGYKIGKKLRNKMVVWFKEINSAPAAGAGVLTLNSLADGIPLAQKLIRDGRLQVGYDGDVDELINNMNNMGMGGGRARRRKSSRKSRRPKKSRKSRKSRKPRK